MKNIIKLFKEINKYNKGFILKVILTSLILGILPLFNIFAPKLIIDELMGDRRLSFVLFVGFLVLILDFAKNIIYRAYNNYLTRVFESMSDINTFRVAEKSLKLPIEKSDSKDIQDLMEEAHHAVWEVYSIYDVLVLVVGSAITG